MAKELLQSRGSRSLKEVLADPFPIYRAYMNRFRERIKRQLPEGQAETEGMRWYEIGAKITAGFLEFGTGLTDLFWDSITLPVNAFEPRLRHPNFKTQLTLLSLPDIVGEVSVPGKEKDQDFKRNFWLWFTPGGKGRIALNQKADQFQAKYVNEYVLSNG